jgi:hypothetical protein
MTLNCLRARQVRNVAVALHRNAMNFERARGFAYATRKTALAPWSESRRCG